MKSIKNITVFIILSFIFGETFSQQMPMYSQYIMNGFLINPSLAGRDGYSSVNLTVREQWAGMAGAPSTYAASFQTRILQNSYISNTTSVRRNIVRPTRGGKVGVGGYIFNDNNGIMRRTGFQAAYAYHIAIGGDPPNNTRPLNNLAFGLALTGYQHYIDLNGPLIYDPNDPIINSLERSVFISDFNFGASYATQKFHVGFAMTNILRGNLVFGNNFNIGDTLNVRNELGHFFLTTGVKIPIGSNWMFEPSGFVKASDMFLNSIQVDITGRMYYMEDYWAGFSYRTEDAIIMMVGLKYDKFYFAYAYDYPLTDIRSKTFGSHELSLAVKFGSSARRYRWINSF